MSRREADRLAARAGSLPGVVVRRTSKGHWSVSRHGRVVAVFPGSPSDHRALKNAVADLRRAGVRV